MSFIYGFESAKDIKLSKQSISNLKHRKIIFKPVLKNINININNLSYFNSFRIVERKDILQR